MKYTTLFIDLDGTIFNFLKAENAAVKATFLKNGVPITQDEAEIYSEINLSFWEKYERKEIKKEDIFESRFIAFLKKIGKTADTAKIATDYFGELAKLHFLIDGAWETLDALKKMGYFLCATTNGVSKTQHRRIKESGIDKFFDLVCVSEDAKTSKPNKEYFDYVISKCDEKDKSKILVIGDSQSSDVLGALNSGLDICFFNEFSQELKYPVTYEINKITDLIKILQPPC